MGRKSSISKLPAEVKALIDEMLRDDKHTLDEILQAVRDEYPEQSLKRSALGRYSQQVDVIGDRMRQAREVAKVWVDRLGADPQGNIGRMAIELLRTQAFDAVLSLNAPDESGKVEHDLKAINVLALALQRLETSGKLNLQQEKEIEAAALAKAADRVSEAALAKGMGEADAAFWRNRVLSEF